MLGSLLMCGLALAEGIQADQMKQVEEVKQVEQVPESIQWVKRILFYFESTAFTVQMIDDHGQLKQVHQVEQAQQMKQVEPTDKVAQVPKSIQRVKWMLC